MSCSDEATRLVLTRRSWLRLAATALLTTSYAAPAMADARSLRPPDRSTRDAGLHSLLATMRTIVGHRDTKALCALMAADFKVEFDVGKGPAVFRQHWNPD